METFIDYYRVLGVTTNASKEEIKKAYRVLTKKYHPDTGGSNEKFIILKKAFDTLYNDVERITYDRIYTYHKTQKKSKEQKRES